MRASFKERESREASEDKLLLRENCHAIGKYTMLQESLADDSLQKACTPVAAHSLTTIPTIPRCTYSLDEDHY